MPSGLFPCGVDSQVVFVLAQPCPFSLPIAKPLCLPRAGRLFQDISHTMPLNGWIDKENWKIGPSRDGTNRKPDGTVEKKKNLEALPLLVAQDDVLSGYNCRYGTKGGCASARGWHENEDNEENEVGSSYIGGKFEACVWIFL